MHIADEVALFLLAAVFVTLVLIVIRQGELMAAVRTVLARTSDMAAEWEHELSTTVSVLIGQGRTGKAIRLYRKSYGASLADAVAAVETIARHKEA